MERQTKYLNDENKIYCYNYLHLQCDSLHQTSGWILLYPGIKFKLLFFFSEERSKKLNHLTLDNRPEQKNQPKLTGIEQELEQKF